jgi:hypothetical protein
MKFFEKLKSIVNIEKFLSENKKITINFKNCNLNLTKTGDLVDFDEVNKKLNFNPYKLEKEKRKKLDNLLLENLMEKRRNKIFENKCMVTLEKLNSYSPKSDEKNLIKFFRDKLLKDDFEILKSSFFIIDDINLPQDILKLKNDLRNKYGEKGVRIVNLVKSGYFNFLKDLYLSDLSHFDKIYKNLVDEGIYTIFVHSKTEILEELQKKIEKIKKYKVGIDFLHIHGLNPLNVRKIKEFLDNMEDNNLFTIEDIYSNKNLIIVRIGVK